MDLRVTLQTMVNRALAHSRRQTDALGKLQEQASTGKRIVLPHDDPLNAVAVINAKAQDVRLDSDLNNIRTARTSLDVGVASLQAANNILVKARELVIEASNSANDPNAFAGLAGEVEALLGRMIDVANTQHNGQYIFAGTKTDTVPFTQDSLGNLVYQGGEARAVVPVSASQTVDTFYTGSEVFQPGPSSTSLDAFEALAALRDDLRNTQGLSPGDQVRAISQRLADLDRVRNNVLEVMGEQSASLQNLEGVETHAQDVQLETRKLAGELESADLADVVVKLQAQENLFRLTLATSAQLFDTSLLEFLR
jgi:flagellar hook-associated protein 3 FlgL